MNNLLLMQDISLVIIAATVIAVIASKLKQPLLLAYVMAGLLLGPLFHLVKNVEPIVTLSDLGIAFLLFIIGLELDLKKIRSLGLSSTLIGFLQVALTTAAGMAGSLMLGFNPIEALYLGLAISFSSTMIVVKLLGEKKELDSLHGELVVGVLVLQDVIAVVALSLVSQLGKFSLASLAGMAVSGTILVAGSFIIYRYLLPWFLKESVQSTELMFISALTVMFVIAGAATFLGYSAAIGAFIAGLCLSTTNYRHEIVGRIKPLKDFFLVLFFVSLGMQLTFNNLGAQLVLLVFLLVFSMVVKPLITFAILRLFKYGARSSFFSSVQLGQIGEFSLVLMSGGILLGHATAQTSSSVTLVTILTMTLTAYVIKYDEQLYSIFRRRFPKLLAGDEGLSNLPKKIQNYIIVFGVHRMSKIVFERLRKLKKDFVVVDYSPEKVKALMADGVCCICSDMTNPEIYETLNFQTSPMVISTVTNLHSNLALIEKVRTLNKKGLIMVASNSEDDALQLYEAGADFVIIPLLLAGDKIGNYLEHLNPEEIRKWGRTYHKEIKRKA